MVTSGDKGTKGTFPFWAAALACRVERPTAIALALTTAEFRAPFPLPRLRRQAAVLLVRSTYAMFGSCCTIPIEKAANLFLRASSATTNLGMGRIIRLSLSLVQGTAKHRSSAFHTGILVGHGQCQHQPPKFQPSEDISCHRSNSITALLLQHLRRQRHSHAQQPVP
jgi:hypothetical protein